MTAANTFALDAIPKTIRSCVDWAAEQFDLASLYYGHGTEDALGEAVYAVFGVLGVAFDCPEETLDQLLDEEQRRAIGEIVALRLDTRKPMAYLLGEAWFCGLPFYVDEHVLVPRSPFAELINGHFEPWLTTSPKRILDIGTGSGCIAIACALAFEHAEMDAVDISPEALNIAQKNVARYSLTDRMQLTQSDLLSALDPNRKYDLIVSNPPYVSQEDIDALPEEYHHEPALGLYGGGDGLDLVKTMLRTIRPYMTDDAILIVEVGLMQDAMDHAFPDLPLTWLEFEHGGEGVFLITAKDLEKLST